MALDQAVEAVGKSVDVAAVLIIVGGAVAASVRFVVGRRISESYSLYRRNLGRAILLGLEFLVAETSSAVWLYHPRLTALECFP